MYKQFAIVLAIFMLLLVGPSFASDELVVLQKEGFEGKKREDYFYLIGTQSRGEPANFTVWRNQFDASKTWNGSGEPNLSVADAVAKAQAFYQAEGELRLMELELRQGYSFKSAEAMNDTVWYYLISLASPSDFTEKGVEGDKLYTVVVLTSGEVVPPYTPK